MQNATKLNRKKVAISHGLELYSYHLTKSFKKAKTLYFFKKYCTLKTKNISEYNTDEKEIKTLCVIECHKANKNIIQLS